MTTATLNPATAEPSVNAKSTQPVQTFRHRNISASIFENKTKNNGTFLSVSLQRTYKDGEEFKYSSSFTRDEIPIARHLLAQAWRFVLDAESR